MHSRFTIAIILLTTTGFNQQLVNGECPHNEPQVEILNTKFFENRPYLKPGYYISAEDDLENVLKIPTNEETIVSLKCNSVHPVKWEYQGLLKPGIVKSVVSNRFFKGPQKNSTICYSAMIYTSISTVFPGSGIGNYTCSHVRSEFYPKKRSLYVYDRIDLPNILMTPRGYGSLQFSVDSINSDKAIIPCLGNHPNVLVELEKEILKVDGISEYQPLNPTAFIANYEAKTGFTLAINRISQQFNSSNNTLSLNGRYRCKLSKHNTYSDLATDLIEITVKKPNPNSKTKSKLTRSNKLKIEIKEYRNENEDRCQQFICSSTAHQNEVSKNVTSNSNHTSNGSFNETISVIPDTLSNLLLSAIQCGSPNECQLVLEALENPQMTLDIQQSFEIKNISLETCPHFEGEEQTTATLNSPSMIMSGAVICRSTDNLEFQYVQFYRTVDPTENQILLYSGENTKFTSASDDLGIISSGISNLSTSNLTLETQQVAMDPDISDPSSVIRVDILSVQKEKVLMNGFKVDRAKIEIRCRWSAFPFARGSQWLIEYSNGTLDTPNMIDSNEKTFKNRMSQMDTIIWAGPTDIKSFICTIPLWNSEKWVNFTYPFTLPLITDATTPNISFDDTDQHISIFCDVDGSPPPTVAWYTQGKRVSSKHVKGIYTDLGETKWRYALQFTEAIVNGLSIAETYTCNATNFKGTTLHQVSIEVKSKHQNSFFNGIWGAVQKMAETIFFKSNFKIC